MAAQGQHIPPLCWKGLHRLHGYSSTCLEPKDHRHNYRHILFPCALCWALAPVLWVLGGVDFSWGAANRKHLEFHDVPYCFFCLMFKNKRVRLDSILLHAVLVMAQIFFWLKSPCSGRLLPLTPVESAGRNQWPFPHLKFVFLSKEHCLFLTAYTDYIFILYLLYWVHYFFKFTDSADDGSFASVCIPGKLQKRFSWRLI